MGYALIAPGSVSRLTALTRSARVAIRVLCGAALMTLLAAFVEAFWSPLPTLPVALKYSVGGALWLLLLTYFLFAGRTRAEGGRDAA